jgi:phage terminase large subunit-like protein
MDLLELQANPAAFREALAIDTDAGPQPFAERMDPWQRADFAALDDGWRRAVEGSEIEAAHSRAWLERPRGHSKTADLAIACSWALFASRRRLSGYGAAADRDQARLLRDSIGRLTFVNAWLSRLIEVESYRVINQRTGSTLEILSSDAPTSYGLLGDFFVCDEVVHWQKRDLWDSLFSSAAKRSTSMLVCISNAGLTDDWSWELREAVRQNASWYFSRLEGCQASWITPKQLEEQKALLPSIAYARLWENQWSAGGGDALSQEVIAAAFRPDLQPQLQAEQGFEYVAGLDLGVSRDASALCILGVKRSHTGHGRIRLAHTQVWRPARGQKVDLQRVEDAVLEAHDRFHLRDLRYDPWQAIHMSSRLQAGGEAVRASEAHKVRGRPQAGARVPMTEVPQVASNLQRMATVLIESFNDRRLELYDEPDLKRDITRLRVEERPYGFRLVSPRDALGHGDLGTAFSLALLAASELAARRTVVASGIDMHTNYPFGEDWSLAALERAREEAGRVDRENREADNAYHAFLAKEHQKDPTGQRRAWRDAMRSMGRYQSYF